MLSKDKKHAKVTLEEKGVTCAKKRRNAQSPPLPVPHGVSA